MAKCYLEAAVEALYNVIVCKFLSYHYVVTSQAVGGFPFWNVRFNFNFFFKFNVRQMPIICVCVCVILNSSCYLS